MSFFLRFWRALNEREQKYFYGLVTLAVISAGGLLITFIGAHTKLVPTQGGGFTEGVLGQPVYVNPVLASSLTDKSLVRLLFANLPDLTDKIESSPDGRTWKVRLKDNLFWADGERLTSDDVIFTVQKLQDPESGSPAFASWQGVSANRISQLEIQFNLANSYVFFNETLATFFPIPKHLFAEVPTANWRLSDYNLKPVASGPYTFKEYIKREDGFISFYSLIPNEHYAGAKPYINSVTLHFFANNDDLLRAFNNGQVDGMNEAMDMKEDAFLRPHQTTSFSLPNYYAVFFNQSTNLALQDHTVREALSRAVNREMLVRDVLHGAGKPVFGPVVGEETAPIPEGASENTGSFDPETILNANGWKKTANGTREKSIKNAKIPLSFELTVPDVPFLVQTGEMLANVWRAIGAQITIKTVSPDISLENTIKNRKYQAIIFGNIINPLGDLFSFWHSQGRFSPGLNLSLYNNKKADKLMETIRKTLDSNERRNALQTLNTMIANDFPAVFLYEPTLRYASIPNLNGIQETVLRDQADRFSQIPEWYLKTKRVLK